MTKSNHEWRDNCRRAYELRRRGMTFEQIAGEMGLTPARARGCYLSAEDQIKKSKSGYWSKLRSGAQS